MFVSNYTPNAHNNVRSFETLFTGPLIINTWIFQKPVSCVYKFLVESNTNVPFELFYYSVSAFIIIIETIGGLSDKISAAPVVSEKHMILV